MPALLHHPAQWLLVRVAIGTDEWHTLLSETLSERHNIEYHVGYRVVKYQARVVAFASVLSGTQTPRSKWSSRQDAAPRMGPNHLVCVPSGCPGAHAEYSQAPWLEGGAIFPREFRKKLSPTPMT
jgi:hypothetical protein